MLKKPLGGIPTPPRTGRVNKSLTSYQLITLNEIMALIPSSAEENTEFRSSKVICFLFRIN